MANSSDSKLVVQPNTYFLYSIVNHDRILWIRFDDIYQTWIGRPTETGTYLLTLLYILCQPFSFLIVIIRLYQTILRFLGLIVPIWYSFSVTMPKIIRVVLITSLFTIILTTIMILEAININNLNNSIINGCNFYDHPTPQNFIFILDSPMCFAHYRAFHSVVPESILTFSRRKNLNRQFFWTKTIEIYNLLDNKNTRIGNFLKKKTISKSAISWWKAIKNGRFFKTKNWQFFRPCLWVTLTYYTNSFSRSKF